MTNINYCITWCASLPPSCHKLTIQTQMTHIIHYQTEITYLMRSYLNKFVQKFKVHNIDCSKYIGSA